MREKIVASFELILMVMSLFAFAHGVYLSDEVFEKLDEKYKEARDSRLTEIVELSERIQPEKSKIGLIGAIFRRLREPMIQVVSAAETSSGIDELGCCFMAKDGSKCGTSEPGNCVADSPFAEGVLCAYASFCQKGCCFDEKLGIYDKNVLEADCSASWVGDPNCNMPEAKLGCCILGTSSIFETLGQCEIDTLARAMGDSPIVDWRSDLDEGQCFLMSATQDEGACILDGGVCTFGSGVDCYDYGGQFSEGFLCTSSLLNSNCEMTEQTTCVDGKDGVYFVDSCGNYANIYDSARVNDQSYWERVIDPENACGNDDIEGNADSKDCGNCNRFFGGICGSATEDNFDVDIGSFYCKGTSCMFDGVSYKNGESWCVYDGAIGNGDDVVGSRHWKYVCSQGVVQIEPCADYRNQICIQTNTFDVEGEEVEFRNAACIANNWRECIDLNGEEDGIDQCVDALNCRVENVDIADKFKFDVCLPRYPGGFSLIDERYMVTAESICGMADQICTVVREPKTWGGCKYVANKACLSEGFAQEMNDFCRGLGDCGGSVNILGEYSENYKVTKSPMLSQSWINKLKALAEPVPGQFAEVEDYSEYLEAAGVWANPEEAAESGDARGMADFQNIGMGLAGIGYTAGLWATGGKLALTGLMEIAGGSWSATVASFAGVAIGAGIGMIAGAYLAEYLELSPGGSMLMAVGGAMVGGAVVYFSLTPALLASPFFWVGIALIVVSLFFGGDDCPPIEVIFECKPWKAPLGGSDCEKCNEDLLKPCSEYRCNSLGSACELVNKGTVQEMCASSSDDGIPPVLSPQFGTISADEIYGDISDSRFSLTSIDGGCIDAYTPLMFGIVTNELAYCRFDMETKEFEEMDFDFGGNSYLYNHTTVFSLPDPSHGQSQGADWNGDLTLYIKCVDVHGHESPGFYTIDMCVNQGPDKTAPRIVATDPVNNAIVGFDVSEKSVSIFTNELSTCRWDLSDVDYSSMSDNMICDDIFGSPSSSQGYLCETVVPLAGGDSVYYIKCMDQPWLDNMYDRNVVSMIYKLRKPEKKIEIDWIEPSQDFESVTDMTTIELQVQTSGGGGLHYCSFSFSGYDKMIKMFETGADRIHVQPLERPIGTSKIYVECTDETGDSVQSWTEFEIIKRGIEMEIEPIEDSVSAFEEVIVDLLVRTSGGGNEHNCSYSLSEDGVGIEFEKQGNVGVHEQGVTVAVGSRTIYVECWDEAGNSAKDDVSFEIIRKGMEIEIEPIEDFVSGFKEVVVYLLVRTSGGGNEHNCSYSLSEDGVGIEFEKQGNVGVHEQGVTVAVGSRTIYVECWDEAGNSAKDDVSFEIAYDTSVPQVARVWQSDKRLYVVTIGETNCEYSTVSCKFNWGDGESAGSGQEHVINVIRGKTYYIKCEDEFGNVPSGCSIIAHTL